LYLNITILIFEWLQFYSVDHSIFAFCALLPKVK